MVIEVSQKQYDLLLKIIKASPVAEEHIKHELMKALKGKNV